MRRLINYRAALLWIALLQGGCLLVADPPTLFIDSSSPRNCEALCADANVRVCLYEDYDWFGYGSCEGACAALWDGTNFSCIISESPECSDVCSYCGAPLEYCP